MASAPSLIPAHVAHQEAISGKPRTQGLGSRLISGRGFQDYDALIIPKFTSWCATSAGFNDGAEAASVTEVYQNLTSLQVCY